MQVESIAPMFNLDSGRPLWIVRKNGNMAVWPRGGKFTGPLVLPGAAYEVRGHMPTDNSNAGKGVSSSPFGVYTSPSFSGSTAAAGPSKKKTWTKVIMIITIKKRGGEKRPWKGNVKVEYEVVTQTHVTLDSSSCTVRRVTELLRKQLNMEVVLLDSKCYPLMMNDSTSGEGFWKSSRKVLAANKALYLKLTGRSTELGRASIDLTKEETSDSDSSGSIIEPATKRHCLSSTLNDKLDEIAHGVANIQKVMMFMKNMQNTFQCVICKGVVSAPVVASCCRRIVGCQQCVATWLRGHNSCPHCSATLEGQFTLRGLDDVTQALQVTVEEPTPSSSGPQPVFISHPPDLESDSDFDDLPPFRS